VDPREGREHPSPKGKGLMSMGQKMESSAREKEEAPRKTKEIKREGKSQKGSRGFWGEFAQIPEVFREGGPKRGE